MTDIEATKCFKNVGRCLSEVATDIEGYHVFVIVRMFRDIVHDEESKTEIKNSTGFEIAMDGKDIQKLSQFSVLFVFVVVFVVVVVVVLGFCFWVLLFVLFLFLFFFFTIVVAMSMHSLPQW